MRITTDYTTKNCTIDLNAYELMCLIDLIDLEHLTTIPSTVYELYYKLIAEEKIIRNNIIPREQK